MLTTKYGRHRLAPADEGDQQGGGWQPGRDEHRANGPRGPTLPTPMRHRAHRYERDREHRGRVTGHDAQPIHCQPHPWASASSSIPIVGRSLCVVLGSTASSTTVGLTASAAAGPADGTGPAKTRERSESVKRPGCSRTSRALVPSRPWRTRRGSRRASQWSHARRRDSEGRRFSLPNHGARAQISHRRPDHRVLVTEQSEPRGLE